MRLPEVSSLESRVMFSTAPFAPVMKKNQAGASTGHRCASGAFD